MRTSPVRTAKLTPTEAAILGLLSMGEASGYDLLKAARRSVGYFWAPAKSQLYGVLPRLVEAGLASSRTVRQASKPDKQLYRITKAGSAALRDWVNSPAPPEPVQQCLMRRRAAAVVILSAALDPDGVGQSLVMEQRCADRVGQRHVVVDHV